MCRNMPSKKGINRRTFLSGVAKASLGAGLYASLGNLQLMNALAMEATTDYRALVCIFLFGGNDSFNMLVPRSDAEYNLYADARKNLAVLQEDILPVTANTPDGSLYGFHPSMPQVQTLFEQGRLAVAANMGTLIEPTTQQDIQQQTAQLPPQLFSHNDQQDFWLELKDGASVPTGWAGRMADLLGSVNNNQLLSMNISIAGSNVWQTGMDTTPFAITPAGIVGLDGLDENSDLAQERARAEAFNNILTQTGHLFSDEYSARQIKARDTGSQVAEALAGQPDLLTEFPEGNSLAQSLRMVTQMIQARHELDVSRQIFFVALGGWDTHGDQLTRHPALLATLSEALSVFNNATEELGVQNEVTTFTAADFGRTLTSNGDGSDHGWGGNQLIMGGAVNGRDIFGSYPELIIGGPDDFGNGRIIPTTSVDQYGATLARWYGGFSESQLSEIFPNLNNFPAADLGFMTA